MSYPAASAAIRQDTDSNNIIDLAERHRHQTQPPGMLDAMLNADLGDDVYGEDPTVSALESRVAGMLGKEGQAYFCRPAHKVI